MAYQTVVHVLNACHDIQISLRSLKHKLKTMQLTKSPNIPDESIHQIINRELSGPSEEHEYRFMCYKLKTTCGVQVKRSIVMKILQEEDRGGTLLRKSRYIKHVTVHTTLGTQTLMTNSNHMGFLCMVA